MAIELVPKIEQFAIYLVLKRFKAKFAINDHLFSQKLMSFVPTQR